MARLVVPAEKLNQFLGGRVISYGAFAAKRVYKREQGKFIGIGWTGRYYKAIGDDIRFTRGNPRDFIVLDSQL